MGVVGRKKSVPKEEISKYTKMTTSIGSSAQMNNLQLKKTRSLFGDLSRSMTKLQTNTARAVRKMKTVRSKDNFASTSIRMSHRTAPHSQMAVRVSTNQSNAQAHRSLTKTIIMKALVSLLTFNTSVHQASQVRRCLPQRVRPC